MLLTDTHEVIGPFIETIGAAVILFEKSDTDILIVSANSRVQPFCNMLPDELVEKSIFQTLPRFMVREISNLVN
jgi:hypothetical protein